MNIDIEGPLYNAFNVINAVLCLKFLLDDAVSTFVSVYCECVVVLLRLYVF